MNKLIFSDDENVFNLNFTLKNSKNSLANALRRLCINEVPTVGFNTIDYENSDLRIIENTTSLNNEFLLHRIGLIPINADSKTFNPSDYLFKLNVQNDTNSTINVTCNDFEITNIATNSKVETTRFFPPDPITKEHILIVKLKPNPTGEGEKINIEGKTSIGNGLLDSRFTPTCVSITHDCIWLGVSPAVNSLSN